jgi:hypothetical protein
MATSNEGSQGGSAYRNEPPELSRSITVDESTSPRPAKGTLLPHAAFLVWDCRHALFGVSLCSHGIGCEQGNRQFRPFRARLDRDSHCPLQSVSGFGHFALARMSFFVEHVRLQLMPCYWSPETSSSVSSGQTHYDNVPHTRMSAYVSIRSCVIPRREHLTVNDWQAKRA